MESAVSKYSMGLHVPRLAYFSVAVIVAVLVLPQVYWQWLETRSFVALDMPVSLSKGEIRTADFAVNLRGWYHVVVWVDSDFSGCWSGLSYHALASRSTAYSNGSVIESTEGRDRYLGQFYAAGKGHYQVITQITSDPTCLNAGHPRIGVWTDSNSYVSLYNQARNTGIVTAIICLGLCAFSFTTTVRVETPSPEASLKMGEVAPDLKMGGTAPESVELRRQRRLPLRRKFAALPSRDPVGGAMILLLLVPVFVMVTQHDLAKGIYVRLMPRQHSGPDENCLEGPIVVSVQEHGEVSQLFLNGTEVGREQLRQALKSKLAGRANWEVFIESDDASPFAEPMYAIDVINSLHAKAVILTPKLKHQLAKPAYRTDCREQAITLVTVGLRV